MKILVVQMAALGYDLVENHPGRFSGLPFSLHPIQTVWPAVTSTAQATFRTALPPAEHGMAANGFFERSLSMTEFWNQSAHLVEGRRIWQKHRDKRISTGMLFWQQSLGEDVDIVLSPAPIHKHSGGMIQDCYSLPRELYSRLCRELGRKFKLQHYWGPFTSKKGSQWIAEATCQVMRDSDLAPDLLFTYLPHLDYTLQRNGPQDRAATEKALIEVEPCLRALLACAGEEGYDVVLWGDYAIEPACQVVYPNLALRRAGWFQARSVGGRSYPDLYASPAVAVVDHQAAHVYVRDPDNLEAVRQSLIGLPGVEQVIYGRGKGGEHPRAGELILQAEEGAWFAYPWWESGETPPDYAGHVDIHNKIGFDPGELFLDRLLPPSVTLDANRIKGTHGRNQRPAAWGSTLDFSEPPKTLQELATAVAEKI